jgi:D-alanyl-D-alanine carboxypeptidase
MRIPRVPRLAVVVAVAAVLLAGCAARTATSTQNTAPSVAPTPAFTPTVPMDPALKGKIDAIAQGAIANGVTGVVVGVHDPQKGDLLAAYGTADSAGTPMTTDMHYRIASVSKSFTATAILELVDQQKVYLDDPLSKWIDNIPNGTAITLRNLLAMRSGLYDYTADPSVADPYAADPLLPGYTVDTALKILRAHAADCTPPGLQTVYSDTNYVLLGYVIQKATGIPVARYLDGLATRTGLNQTTFPTGPDMPAPFSSGYADGKDVTRSNPLVPWTAGAMVSTVPDMMAYAAPLATGAGITPATFGDRTAFTRINAAGARVDYGLGISRYGEWLGHDGAITGYSDVVVNRPASGTSIVVMLNGADGRGVPAIPPFVAIARALYPASVPG